MQPKKCLLVLAFFTLFSQLGFSQGDAGATWKDTSKVSSKSQAQLNDFLNHTYPYPPKPRSKWELGFAVGNSTISGDVNNKVDLGGAITLRKALSHTFSVRLGYFGSYNQGYPSEWGLLIGQRSYQNWTHREAIDIIASLNPISHYRGNPKTNIYILGGIDHIASIVYYRAKPVGTYGQGYVIDNAYRVFYGGYAPRREANTNAGLLGTHGKFRDKRTGRGSWSSMLGGSVGAGFALKLSSKINLAIEQRFTFTNYDYLDAFKGDDNKDYYSFTSGRINFNLGSSSKKVEPLWWINPNNYVYNELNRPSHMVVPPPVLPDSDNDGVTDQFDMEPNTPAGAPVDVRGVAKDTDADGVPDYKDKELLTSSKCLPVNADGVGTCPEPACCKELRDRLDTMKHGGGNGGGGGENGENCGLNDLPSIKFAQGSSKLSSANIALLANSAAQIKAQPDCHINVIGHGTSDKRAQQLSWERVNAVINYFVSKQGISRGRFIFTYNGGEGDADSVDLVGTKDNGPNTVPAPHPNLRSKK